MNLPNVWGQGALFTYSGLEGECDYNKSLLSYLSGDRVGIRFAMKTPRELSFDMRNAFKLTHKCVSSDYISLEVETERAVEEIKIFFVSQNLIVGFTSDLLRPIITTYGECIVKNDKNTRIYIDEQEISAFATKSENNRIVFSFSYGNEVDDVIDNAKSGLCSDFESIEKKKIFFYESLPQIDADESIKVTFAKCASVMKSQFYSGNGKIRGLWTSPDKLPHRNQWLWDAVFHSIGNKYISVECAKSTITSVLDMQRDDGMIPHRGNSAGDFSDITQPPILAWGILLLCEYTNDYSFAKENYAKLKKYLEWNEKNRSKNGLFKWYVKTESVHCRCDECGMDNSPRFDEASDMFAIDFTCFMANEMRCMMKIAKKISADEDEFWNAKYEFLKKAIEDNFWDESSQFYFDFDNKRNDFKKIWSVASFLPLFAGVCSKERAKVLVKYLNDKERFETELPIPSIAKNDKTFGTDMWRGPVWINYNYMISLGLKEYGFNDEASKIIDKTIDEQVARYLQDGTIYEYYDSERKLSPTKLNRKGYVEQIYDFNILSQSIRDYGWSSTLLAEMIYEKYKK